MTFRLTWQLRRMTAWVRRSSTLGRVIGSQDEHRHTPPAPDPLMCLNHPIDNENVTTAIHVIRQKEDPPSAPPLTPPPPWFHG